MRGKLSKVPKRSVASLKGGNHVLLAMKKPSAKEGWKGGMLWKEIFESKIRSQASAQVADDNMLALSSTGALSETSGKRKQRAMMTKEEKALADKLRRREKDRARRARKREEKERARKEKEEKERGRVRMKEKKEKEKKKPKSEKAKGKTKRPSKQKGG